MSENKDPVRELIIKHCREKVHKFLTVPTLYEQLAGLGSEANMKKRGVCFNIEQCVDTPYECDTDKDCFKPKKSRVSVRKFETGATRDTDEGKPDYAGYLSPLVIERYGQYMLKHQKQADGTMRSSDNWKKGMSKDVYMSSMFRHFIAVWKKHELGSDVDEDLCALMFNVMGYLYEEIKVPSAQKVDAIYDWVTSVVNDKGTWRTFYEQNTGRHIEDEKLMED